MIKVMLVDDHAVVRQGYRRLLEQDPNMSVVAEAGDASSAYQLYKSAGADVVVVDIGMPGRGGIDLIRQLRRWDPKVRALVFSMHASASFAVQSFRAGARGYVTKSSDPETLVAAVKAIARNRPALCPEIAAALAASRLKEDTSGFGQLSPREFEVLRLIIEANTTDEIASALHLSSKTVANYHYAIKSKLGVSSDIDLIYYCMQHGLTAELVDSFRLDAELRAD
jgi:two-component system invasion response regulator UvrY